MGVQPQVRTKKERGGRKAWAEGEGDWIFMLVSLPLSQMTVRRPVVGVCVCVCWCDCVRGGGLNGV
jgi:hypothetical protein